MAGSAPFIINGCATTVRARLIHQRIGGVAEDQQVKRIAQMAVVVDLVTFEFESVPAETVAFLSQFVPADE